MKSDFLIYSFTAPKRVGWGYIDLLLFMLIVSVPIILLFYVPSLFMEDGGWRISDINPILYNVIYLIRGCIASTTGGLIGAAYVLVTLNSENETHMGVKQIWDALRGDFWRLIKYMIVIFFVFELIYLIVGLSIIFYNNDDVSSLLKIHLVVRLSLLGSPIAAVHLLVLTVGIILILKFKRNYIDAIEGVLNYFKTTPLTFSALSFVFALLLSFDIEYFYLLDLFDIQFSGETGINLFIAMMIIVFLMSLIFFFVCPVIFFASIIYQYRQLDA